MLKHFTIDITPLRVSRDYRLLFFGQLISFFGSMMSFVVMPWQMFELTGSSEMVGYLYLVEAIPMVILGLLGGAFADYFDKRSLLRLTEIGQTIVSAILLINAFSANPRIWVLFLAAALHAGFAAIQRPAFEAFIQKIIPNEMMAAVMALNSMRWSIGAIVSPAIAGLITTQYGSKVAYGIDLITFAASLIAVFFISSVPSSVNAEKPSLKGIIEGWKYAMSRQELLGTYLIDIVAMFFAFPQALYPALANAYGKEYLGLFWAAIATGALLASLTSGWTKGIHRHGAFIVGAAALWGVAILFFGLSTNIWVALFFLMIAGSFDMVSGIFRGAIWNQTIPNYLRGRLASIEMMSYLIGPFFGSAKMGIVAERFSIETALISGGIMCVAAVAILAIFLPKFLTYDGREGIKRRELEEKLRESGFEIK